MRLPRFRVRTFMLAVVVAALILVAVPPIVRAWRYMHVHNVYIGIGPFTIHF